MITVSVNAKDRALLNIHECSEEQMTFAQKFGLRTPLGGIPLGDIPSVINLCIGPVTISLFGPPAKESIERESENEE